MAKQYNYLIIGAGGSGGVLAHDMTRAGLYVTSIARGEHLRAIRANGLTIRRPWNRTSECLKIKATDMQHYSERPDVIFLCVKDYSLKDCYSFIRSVSKRSTIVIPLLNGLISSRKVREDLPEYTVPGGLIYVSANISEPGYVEQHGKLVRVAFGMQNEKDKREIPFLVSEDMKSRGLDVKFTETIERDIFEKFSYVSPAGTAGLFYGAAAGDFQKPGEPRTMFMTMIREIMTLAFAMGCPFEDDYVKMNLEIMDGLLPSATTSMQRDVTAGRTSEIDALLFEVLRLGKKYRVSMPAYEMAAEGIEERYHIH